MLLKSCGMNDIDIVVSENIYINTLLLIVGEKTNICRLNADNEDDDLD